MLKAGFGDWTVGLLLSTLGGAVVPMWMIAATLGLSTKLLRRPRGQSQDSVR